MSMTRRRRVLVVDDDQEVAESLAELIRLLGHDVYTAHDARAALGESRRVSPEVVIVDLLLADESGTELAHRLRAAGQGDTPILVALSGRTAGPCGDPQPFDHWLRKPVDIDVLEAILVRPAGP